VRCRWYTFLNRIVQALIHVDTGAGGYDLIAMATHGRSGLLRLVIFFTQTFQALDYYRNQPRRSCPGRRARYLVVRQW
jgi:hypothetical protein